MGIYQRDERWMVYWHENGKRRDKSFGRGEDGQLKAEAFDLAIKLARSNGSTLPDLAMVSLAAPIAVDPSGPAPVRAVEASAATLAPFAAPVAPVAAPTTRITFGQLATMYLDHLRVSGRTEKHIHSLDKLLKNMFFDILGKDTLVEGMTYLKDIVPFIKQMQGVSPQTKKPRSQASVNRYCDYVDAIFVTAQGV